MPYIYLTCNDIHSERKDIRWKLEKKICIAYSRETVAVVKKNKNDKTKRHFVFHICVFGHSYPTHASDAKDCMVSNPNGNDRKKNVNTDIQVFHARLHRIDVI